MRLPLGLAVSALLASAMAAGAQSSPSVDGRRLPLGADSLAVLLVRGGDTTRTGTVREELTHIDEGGRLLLHRVYASMDQVLGLRLDSLVDVAESLEPVRHRSRTENGAEHLDFADGRVTGWLRMANGDTVTVATPLPPGVVNASAFDLVLRAADLREGWSAEVPAFMRIGPDTEIVFRAAVPRPATKGAA